ncbi:hypothetical protein CA13_18220 [Planctomycetes bacterium CA13]|uniref:Uncharacterized protein n=1 Tax=Novipirellula herctigrandis TaxID=2527986 RepID=A0A5C5Z074_9BACT|nr:hypothetical protein CA13_18220 [Planctomycetes bacterium CA13]
MRLGELANDFRRIPREDDFGWHFLGHHATVTTLRSPRYGHHAATAGRYAGANDRFARALK